MLVLGIDPALCNCGWYLATFSEELIPSPHPSWDIRPQTQSYRSLVKEASGKIVTQAGEPIWQRIQHQADSIHSLLLQYQPEFIASEGVLIAGMDRNISGLAVVASIVDKLRPTDWAASPFIEAEKITTKTVVLIDPGRVQRIVHNERSTKIAEVKRRYFEVSLDTVKRISDHEADAYFILNAALRFWMTRQGRWSKDILSETEKAVFFTATKEKGKKGKKTTLPNSLNDLEGHTWWTRERNPNGI